MTNVQSDLPAAQEKKLRDCYELLSDLAASCEVPAVRAAARLALAEVYAAIDGQALEFELYSGQWENGPEDVEQALVS
ncbi:hypothetical protein CFN78_17290 [Amycolatopsis antarctica]|uniref:Uncharacterized protein n=1 Tax=Amycolatopsis antarctica TaxID=1854586 RepID=A0A263D366_9PSEU|nr:DUF6052 family protein [Amycolatopsis antarctica]OZM71906.1 hypothetical protein CFN78_17290 [Amycolatopsis antarctica]